ncbi:MAG TPA: acetyl-CoA C-acyltransferase, partial [Actinomycetota bacterium]|nr:acetyl-CoA C-acyltransferase [Actinomycetota bacterium]
MTRSVIVAGARTPIGRFQGAFASVPAVDLGAHAIRAAVERAGIAPEQVEYAIVGHVLQAGAGQITSLQASIGAGLPKDVPAITINKVCLSGMSAIAIADQMIRAGELSAAVAGGMESMTNAPYVVPRARAGARLGDVELIDTMVHDGLWSSFRNHHMGAGTDEISAELGLAREEQDAWAARSHRRAAAAWDEGRMAEEVVPMTVASERGSVVVERDEGIRPDTTAERLASLRPAFSPDGTVTAGNASQLSDGACAVVVLSEEKASELGLEPLAEIVAYGMSSDRYPSLHTVPALALERALKRAGHGAADLGLVEINEAFSAVPIHSTRMLGVDE